MMMKLLVVATLAALLALQAAAAVQAAVVPDDAEKLCSGKLDVELTSVSHLQTLAAGARGAKSCPGYLKEALVELGAIVGHDKDDLCNPDSIDTLRAFYTQYMDNASIKEDKKRQLPEPLLKFVIAYGLQMSNLCKKQMVKVLTEEARQELLEASDFEAVNSLTEAHGPLGTMLSAMGGPDEIFMPGDLAAVLNKKGGKKPTDDKLYLQSATGPKINQIKAVCEHRFKPIYEPLMIPLVRLSNMGFDYKDEPLKCALSCSKTAMEVGQWSSIVFLCESLASVNIVDSPKDSKDGTEAVHVISQEEAQALGPVAASIPEGDLKHLEYKAKEQIKLPGDLVLDESNELFAKAVKSFKVGQSEAEKAKKKIAERGMAILKENVKQGHMGFIISSAVRSMTKRETNSPGSMLVKTLDEMVAHPNANTGAFAGVKPMTPGATGSSLVNENGELSLFHKQMVTIALTSAVFFLTAIILSSLIIFG